MHANNNIHNNNKKTHTQKKTVNLGKKKNTDMSEVGFEPTPTRVDCDLNAAP